MRRVNLNRYVKEKKGEFRKRLLRMNKGRLPLRRQRSDTERTILMRLDRLRWEEWMRNGRIKVLGPRRYRIKLSI